MMQIFKNRSPLFFSAAFLIVFAASFSVFIEFFRTYRAEATVIVLSKSPSVSAETTAGNLSILTKSDSFYETLILDHENISDPWAELPLIERGDAWSKIVSARVIPGTSLIELSLVSRESAFQSQALLQASLETLYGFSGRWYNRDREADIRLANPVSVRVAVESWSAPIILSAFVSGLIIFAAWILVWRMIPSLHSFGSQLHASRFGVKIRPVGSFQALNKERESLVTPSGSSGNDLETFSQAPEVPGAETGTDEQDLSDIAEVTEVSNPAVEPAQDSLLAEPVDIWEKMNVVPRGELGVRNEVSKKETSIDRRSPSDLGKGSSVLRNESSENNNVDSSRDGYMQSDREDEGVTSIPGNLESIPAKDFSWDRLFVSNGERSSREEIREARPDTHEQAAISLSDDNEMRREPTPEELKNRLNQLLRGEM